MIPSASFGRRTFLGGAVVAAVMGGTAEADVSGKAPAGLFGLIGKFSARPGEREALIALLLGGSSAMPGCLSYVVARDRDDADAVWITEVWDSEASHAAALQLPAVRAAVRDGLPLIDMAADGYRHRTDVAGGVGLPPR